MNDMTLQNYARDGPLSLGDFMLWIPWMHFDGLGCAWSCRIMTRHPDALQMCVEDLFNEDWLEVDSIVHYDSSDDMIASDLKPEFPTAQNILYDFALCGGRSQKTWNEMSELCKSMCRVYDTNFA